MIADLTTRHRAEEFRRFLNLIDKTVPAQLDVHVVVDNSSTHKTPAIQRWLLRHPRFTFHYTPSYSSWLNLVERWFAELTGVAAAAGCLHTAHYGRLARPQGHRPCVRSRRPHCLMHALPTTTAITDQSSGRPSKASRL